MKKRYIPKPKKPKPHCLHCYSKQYEYKGNIHQNYQLCPNCYISLRDSEESPIEGVTGEQYLLVYHSWKVAKWDVDQVEKIRDIKEKILFGKFLHIFIE